MSKGYKLIKICYSPLEEGIKMIMQKNDHAKQRALSMGIRLACIAAMLALLMVVTLTSAKPVAYAKSGDWPTFLGNNARTGFNGAETIINPSTAHNLKLHWTQTVKARISAEPVEANGMVYWGAWDGIEHASRLSDGKDVWTANLGAISGNCIHLPHGVLSIATISTLKIGGVKTPVDFVGGGDENLYALNASTGKIIWHTLLGGANSFLFSSPAVFGKSVYIGVASLRDCPLVQGTMQQVNAATGAIQHTFDVVPNGCIGGTVWGSPTVDSKTSTLYFGTGNEGTCSTTETMTDAVVALRTTDLSLVGSWQVPSSQRVVDGDFGTTPTLFPATINGVLHQMLGLMNKNGIYYAFDRTNISAGPLWQDQLAAPAMNGENNVSSSAWDGTALYAAAALTTIKGTSCNGSLRALNPADGTFLWQDCLSNVVLAPVTSVPGLAVAESGTSLMIVDATTGNHLFNYQDTNPSSNFSGPASISNGVLYQGNMDGKMYAFGP